MIMGHKVRLTHLLTKLKTNMVITSYRELLKFQKKIKEKFLLTKSLNQDLLLKDRKHMLDMFLVILKKITIYTSRLLMKMIKNQEMERQARKRMIERVQVAKVKEIKLVTLLNLSHKMRYKED